MFEVTVSMTFVAFVSQTYAVNLTFEKYTAPVFYWWRLAKLALMLRDE